MQTIRSDHLIASSGYERKQHGTKDFPCAAYVFRPLPDLLSLALARGV